MLEHIIKAAEIGKIIKLPRIDKNNPYLIRKVLEIEADGFILREIMELAIQLTGPIGTIRKF